MFVDLFLLDPQKLILTKFPKFCGQNEPQKFLQAKISTFKVSLLNNSFKAFVRIEKLHSKWISLYVYDGVKETSCVLQSRFI